MPTVSATKKHPNEDVTSTPTVPCSVKIRLVGLFQTNTVDPQILRSSVVVPCTSTRLKIALKLPKTCCDFKLATEITHNPILITYIHTLIYSVSI